MDVGFRTRSFRGLCRSGSLKSARKRGGKRGRCKRDICVLEKRPEAGF